MSTKRLYNFVQAVSGVLQKERSPDTLENSNVASSIMFEH